jgi:hypothetical protein
MVWGTISKHTLFHTGSYGSTKFPKLSGLQLARFESTEFFHLRLHAGTLQEPNVARFQKIILKIWIAIPDDFMRVTCNAFKKRLRLVFKTKGFGFLPQKLDI